LSITWNGNDTDDDNDSNNDNKNNKDNDNDDDDKNDTDYDNDDDNDDDDDHDHDHGNDLVNRVNLSHSVFVSIWEYVVYFSSCLSFVGLSYIKSLLFLICLNLFSIPLGISSSFPSVCNLIVFPY